MSNILWSSIHATHNTTQNDFLIVLSRVISDAVYQYRKLHDTQAMFCLSVARSLFFHYRKLHGTQAARILTFAQVGFFHYRKVHGTQATGSPLATDHSFFHYRKLHGTQASEFDRRISKGSSTIESYTVLKQRSPPRKPREVLPLSKATRYSSVLVEELDEAGVLPLSKATRYSSPALFRAGKEKFFHYRKLHGTQARAPRRGPPRVFFHYRKLHGTQARLLQLARIASSSTIESYTVLKQDQGMHQLAVGSSTIESYTVLKRRR